MNLTNRTFGIELEIVVPSTINIDRLCTELSGPDTLCVSESYNHNRTRHWKLVSDGSVRSSRVNGISYWPIELVSPVLTGEHGLRCVRFICEKLVELGVRVNRSCGFHVHHGASDFKAKHFENLFALYRNCELELDQLMPDSRRSNNNVFCQSLKAKSVSRLQSDRYHKVNLCSFSRHGTVEFRHHSGTVDADKVCNWVRLTQAMVERAKRKVNPADHNYTWYDVKQVLGLVHTTDRVAIQLASYYDSRRTTHVRRASLEARRSSTPAVSPQQAEAARLASRRAGVEHSVEV